MENDKERNQTGNKGSQVSSVNPFGILQDKQDASNIKNRIGESRRRNLTSMNAFDNTVSNTSSGLSKDNRLEKNKSKENKTEEKGSKKSKSQTEVSEGSKFKSGVKNTGKALGKNLVNSGLNKASEDSDVANAAVNAGKAGVNTVKNIKKLTKLVKKAIMFFASPIGIVVGYILLIIILIVFVIVFVNTFISNLGMKFGLTSNETYDAFNGCFEEGMSREEIEEIMTKIEKGEINPETCEEVDPDENESDVNTCKVGFFGSIKHFFGIWDTTDPCELSHYIKHIIEKKEKQTGISTISPGYFVSTLYYSFDTQNNNEDGELFIKPKDYESVDEEGKPYFINDLDAITTLIDVGIYRNSDIETLLDNYILHYIADEDAYPIYKWEWVYPVNATPYQTCVLHSPSEDWEVDELKYKLYLRYGQGIVDKYEDDKNKLRSFNSTSPNCRYLLPFNKPGMSKYNKKADPNTKGNDNAKIDGVGYNSGFIYKTYPRYNPKYIIGGESFYNYNTDKDIEQIIENTDDRQNYANYALGYPNTVETTDSITGSFSTGATCVYRSGEEDISNIKVRLLHAKNNDAIPGVGSYEVIKEEELVDFDKYILGVVYAEAGNSPKEVLKTQAVAVQSYILANAESGRFKKVEEDGNTIIEISNSTFHQTYCDPDKGCQACFSSNYKENGIVTLLSNGVNIEESSCRPHFDAISSNSPIRSAVKEVMGMSLVNNDNKIVSTGYNSDTYKNWVSLESGGANYVEILRSTYGSEYMISSPDCKYGASGEWASWRQYAEPWGSMMVSTKTFGQIGCFMTSYAMALAKSAPRLTISNFNPATFLTAIKRNGCLSGNNLYSDCAIRTALGDDVQFVNAGASLSGYSYNQKVSVISNYLNNGYDVLLRVRSEASAIKYGGGDQHWVLVTGVDGNNIYMADPASDETIVLNRYYNEGIVSLQYVKFG